MPVTFTSVVPLDEGFENPQYIKVEQRFSKKVKPSRIHDCIVTVGRDTFLVSAYWEGGDGPNRAVAAACPGLEWQGEIAVVQAGRFVTFYKRVRNPSLVNRAVSKWVVQSMFFRTLLITFTQVRVGVQVQRLCGRSSPHEPQRRSLACSASRVLFICLLILVQTSCLNRFHESLSSPSPCVWYTLNHIFRHRPDYLPVKRV